MHTHAAAGFALRSCATNPIQRPDLSRSAMHNSKITHTWIWHWNSRAQAARRISTKYLTMQQRTAGRLYLDARTPGAFDSTETTRSPNGFKRFACPRLRFCCGMKRKTAIGLHIFFQNAIDPPCLPSSTPPWGSITSSGSPLGQTRFRGKRMTTLQVASCYTSIPLAPSCGCAMVVADWRPMIMTRHYRRM